MIASRTSNNESPSPDPQRGNQFGMISDLKNRIEDRNSKQASVTMAGLMGGLPLNMKPPETKPKPQEQQAIAVWEGAADETSTSRQQQDHFQEYKILRSLPTYNVGDQLRDDDSNLFSKEATAYAKSKLRPNDCAFILRSDGNFSYAIYEGYAKEGRDKSAMSFMVDVRGHFKILSVRNFLTLVKIPVLHVALVGKMPGLEKYANLIGSEAGQGGDDQVQASTMVECNPTAAGAGFVNGTSTLPRSTSVGQMGQKVGRSGSNPLAMFAPTSTSRSSRPVDAQNILSRMVTANTIGSQGGSGAGKMDIRVASMQDFRQSKLNSQASNRLGMNAPSARGSNAAFTLTRNNTTQGSLAGLSMQDQNISNGSLSNNGAHHSVSTGQLSTGSGRFSSNGTMPRNITLRHIAEEDNQAGGSGKMNHGDLLAMAMALLGTL